MSSRRNADQKLAFAQKWSNGMYLIICQTAFAQQHYPEILNIDTHTWAATGRGVYAHSHMNESSLAGGSKKGGFLQQVI